MSWPSAELSGPQKVPVQERLRDFERCGSMSLQRPFFQCYCIGLTRLGTCSWGF